MISRDSSGFLMIAGSTLQEIFGTEDPKDPKANPVKIHVTQETSHDDSTRPQSGDFPPELPTILNRKSKITVTWNKLRVEWLGKLFDLLGIVYPDEEPFSFTQNISVRFLDLNGRLKTAVCYVGPTITGQLLIDVSGNDLWDNVQISFIEK